MANLLPMILAAALKGAEYLVGPVGRLCGYVFFTDRKVEQLDGELKELVYAREMVGSNVKEARNNMKPIFSSVEKWVEYEQIVANTARSVLDYNGRAQKTCCYGRLPNPKARYRLGKDASKMVKEIQKLIAQRNKWEKVYHENPPPGLVHVGAPNVEGGRPFHMIVKAKVSQHQDFTKIRYDIAYALSLDLTEEPSEEGKKGLLSKRLQRDPNEKVLIILDDLWDELDLKAVGIPSGEGSKGCKLLLTSRHNNVLLQKMHADRTFRLKGLEDVEAVRLFEKTVGDRLKDEVELKPIAAQVATKLAGLPLLIISIAKALKNSDVGAWRGASEKIDVEEMETIVQLSYDRLKGDDTKSLFLLCGLIGGTIKVETLLVLGIGMGLIERRTIQGSRDRLDTMLSELRFACLLLDGGDDKENVTIHDLYSEVVVSPPFSDQNSLIIYDNCGMWPKEKLEECRACLVDVGNDRLVELMPHRFPQAKILMLSEKNDMGDCSKKYFKDMKELRALCLYSRSITNLPSPIEILGKLQSLIINCRLRDVTILGKLKALEILSFAGSTTFRLAKEIGKLTNLRSLNIGRSNSLIIESGVLEGLINLEELHMKGGDHQWMKEDETPSSWYGARLAELKSLTRLTSLEIYISGHALLLDDDLPAGNLTRFFLSR